jgi:hypothetical protein
MGSLSGTTVTSPTLQSQKTTILAANVMTGRAISTGCAIGNNIVCQICTDWILCVFSA